MYTVNIADWTKYVDDFGLNLILHPVVDRSVDPVHTERGRFDGMGITLNCDDERTAAIVAIVRKKYEQWELRMYHSKTGRGGWKRV